MKKFGTLIGNSSRMKSIYGTIEKAAGVDVPVFIIGETGTGKELVAREIHNRSARKDKPFVAVNMGAVPSELVASELFGHIKGSFTGATENRIGRFQEASDGTLFLDEIITMDERVQISLLRVLESKKFRQVGGRTDYETNARILAAANQDPEHEVRSNHFRSDLLHRLQVIRINIPPLRDRKSDIQQLAQHFFQEICSNYSLNSSGISLEAMNILKEYPWPGNVRELRNVIFHAAIMAGDEDISPQHLPEYLRDEQKANLQIAESTIPDHQPQEETELTTPVMQSPTGFNNTAAAAVANPAMANTAMREGVFLPLGLSMEEVEKVYITKTLAMTGQNKTRTAKLLGISRKSLYSKLQRLGLMEE